MKLEQINQEEKKTNNDLIYYDAMSAKNFDEFLNVMEQIKSQPDKDNPKSNVTEEMIQYVKDVRDGKRSVSDKDVESLGGAMSLVRYKLESLASESFVTGMESQEKELGISKLEMVQELIKQGRFEEVSDKLDKISSPRTEIYKEVLKTYANEAGEYLRMYKNDEEFPISEAVGVALANKDYSSIAVSLDRVNYIDPVWLADRILSDDKTKSAPADYLLEIIKVAKPEQVSKIIDTTLSSGNADAVVAIMKENKSRIDGIDYEDVINKLLSEEMFSKVSNEYTLRDVMLNTKLNIDFDKIYESVKNSKMSSKAYTLQSMGKWEQYQKAA